MSAERKSCNSSGWWIIHQRFGGFLNSVVISKRDSFLIFSEWIVEIGCKSQCYLFCSRLKINFSSKCLIQRTEFFIGNQSLWFTDFTHFLRRLDFPRGKENVDTFSQLVWYPLEQLNAMHLLTIFVKQNITKKLQCWNAINYALANLPNSL